MSKKDTNEEPSEEVEAVEVKEKPKCFVIMPISDPIGYEPGHFRRVYDMILIPAIINAGFVPERADDISQAHYILLNILKSVVSYDMAICDLSSSNPNVLYELGIRQMAKKPVVLIKDEITNRLFDISGINTIEYHSSLRVDTVNNAVDKITKFLISTFENKDNLAGSLLDMLGIKLQLTENKVKISPGEKMILEVLEEINQTSSDTVNLNNNLDSVTSRITSQIVLDHSGKKIKPPQIVKSLTDKGSIKKGKYYVAIDLPRNFEPDWNLCDLETYELVPYKLEPFPERQSLKVIYMSYTESIFALKTTESENLKKVEDLLNQSVLIQI